MLLEKSLSGPIRLQALDLQAPRAQLESISSTIMGSAPELKRLRLVIPSRDFGDLNGDNAAFMIGLSAPNLRSPVLEGISGSWIHFVGPNITHLRLTFLRPTIAEGDLFDILRRLPLLALLHLEHTTAITSSSQNDAECVRRGSIHLPMVSQITLIEPMGTCAEILRKLRLPRTCSVRIACKERSTDPALASDAADELIALLIVHLHGMRGTLPLESFDLDSAPGWWHLVCVTAEEYTLNIEITFISPVELWDASMPWC